MEELKFEFIGRVVVSARQHDLPSEVIELVSEMAEMRWKEGLVFKAQMGEAIDQILKRAQGEYERRIPPVRGVPSSPEKEITEVELFAKVHPKLMELREGMSGLVQLPFPSTKEAAQWVREVVKSDPKPTKKEAKKAEQLWNQADALCGEMERLLHCCNGDIAVESRTSSALPFLKEKSKPDTVVLSSESPLLQLAQETARLAEYTGFSQRGLVQWVLTEQKAPRPVLPVFAVDHKVRSTPFGLRPYAAILCNAYPTLENLRELRSQLKAIFQVPRKIQHERRPKISDKDQQLIQVIGNLYGRTPSGEIGWKKIGKYWTTPRKGSNWKAIKRYWYRLEKKAQRLGLDLSIVLREIHSKPTQKQRRK